MFSRFDRIAAFDRQTDGRTDGRTDRRSDILPQHSPRYAYASRGKTKWITVSQWRKNYTDREMISLVFRLWFSHWNTEYSVTVHGKFGYCCSCWSLLATAEAERSYSKLERTNQSRSTIDEQPLEAFIYQVHRGNMQWVFKVWPHRKATRPTART